MMESDRRLDALFAEYREAVAAPEPGVNFMPRLWERIDGKRTFALKLKRISQVFVAGAAVTCLLMAGVMVLPRATPAHPATYIDVLAEAHPVENLAAQGIVHSDLPEAAK